MPFIHLAWTGFVGQALGRSLALSTAVSMASGVLGCVLAWLVTRTQLPSRRMLARVLSIPYCVPAYLLGVAWIVLGNPQVGLIRSFLPSNGIYGFLGMFGVETSVAFAFPFLELKAAFERLDPSLEEAARMSGASAFRVFRTISFPLLWPALFSGALLSFLYTLSSFGVPALLGIPVRQYVLTTLIYSEIKTGGESGIQTGILLSGFLLVMALLLLTTSFVFDRRLKHRTAAIMSGKAPKQSLLKLRGWKYPAAILIWGWVTLILILPWIALALCAWAPVAGQYAPKLWTLGNLRYVLSLPEFREGLFNSALLSFGVSGLLLFLGFVIGFYAARRKQWWAKGSIAMSAIFFSIPGTVIALLVIFISALAISRLGTLGECFDLPLIWMGLAYGLKYSAVTFRPIRVAFDQIDPSLEEAARVCGAQTLPLLKTIWLPLLRGTLGAVALLCVFPIFTELTMSVLLTGPGSSTLGTVLFQLQEYSDQPAAAALGWLLLSLALAIAALTAGKGEE